MANVVNPNSNSGQGQENSGNEPLDLGQSRYDFRSLVFPNDLGMDDNGHYMIININVPTKTLRPTTPAGRYTGPEYITQLPEFTPSKVDRLRYGPSGGLTGVVSRTTGFIFGGSENVNAISLRRRTMRIAESIALHMQIGRAHV